MQHSASLVLRCDRLADYRRSRASASARSACRSHPAPCITLRDPKAQTADMLPAFLRYLRDNDYRVVNVVPASPGPQSRNQLEKSYNSDN